MEAIRTAKQAARDRLSTLCAWASADDYAAAPANPGSLQLLADAVDLRAGGHQTEYSVQAGAAVAAAQAGAVITTGQPTDGGRWHAARHAAGAEPALPLQRGWDPRDLSAGCGIVPPCHPLSWRCTEAAGEDCPPWLPQWHRGSAGVAGQSVQVLPIR